MKNKLQSLGLSLALLLLNNILFAQHFSPVWESNPQFFTNIIFSTIESDGLGLEAGDEIAAFDTVSGSQVCVGVEVLAEGFSYPVTLEAGMDDGEGGASPDHEIIYRIWDKSELMEITYNDPEYNYVPGVFDTVYGNTNTVLVTSLVGLSHTWTGSTDDDWNDKDNWNAPSVPNNIAYVKIPASGVTNYPTLLVAGECENLQLKANASGVGSLMDDGNLTIHGTATVETYLTNSAGAGSFDLHLIGPTVDEENYTGGGTGAFLSAFNIVDGSTYAFDYDEATGNWDPLETLSTEIRTGKGIALSTTDNTAHTLSITGALMTGAVSSPSLTTGGTSYEMISNPYPSAVNFPALATTNSTLVENKYWIWNPATGNYNARAGTIGATPYIQVGQGFIVETKSSGAFNFTNSERAHSDTTSFVKNDNSNLLTVSVAGGEYEFKDVMYIGFLEDATPNYDVSIEAVKWYSSHEDATMIYSIAEDDTDLAINILPLETLGIENISVPFNFVCGYEVDYTLNFSGMETFTTNEIWLEDKLTGEDWINLNQNPEYTFIGSPDDDIERFEIHFYGPTGIDDLVNDQQITVTSNRQTIFLVNNSNQKINEVSVYDISGRLILQENNLTSKTNHLVLNEKSGYYIVKVITDQTTQSNKVLISAN